VPTVVVTTPNFLNLAQQCAKAFGLPNARIVVVEHPISGIEEPAVLERARSIIEDVLGLWVAE
jgi:hypothetical protein